MKKSNIQLGCKVIEEFVSRQAIDTIDKTESYNNADNFNKLRFNKFKKN